jgi:acetyl-CoA carboxylase biotin carboxyl carrier protein
VNPSPEQSDGRDPAGPGLVLEAVCRSVVRLAESTPHPPLRIRMQDGQTTVEVEWPERVRNGQARTDDPGVDPVDPVGPDGAATRADELTYVRAPMVGTFYHAGAPDARPYVSVGDLVLPGQPVGVVEAMKMMNTITADTAGRVVEVLTPNAHPVEYDQPLIALEPVDEEAVDQP